MLSQSGISKFYRRGSSFKLGTVMGHVEVYSNLLNLKA